MDYSAQHMWWYELRVAPQGNGPSHQLASESSGFIALAQSPWRLFVIPTPNNKAFAGNPCNGRGFVQVPVLLALIIRGQHRHLTSTEQPDCMAARIPGGSHHRNQ